MIAFKVTESHRKCTFLRTFIHVAAYVYARRVDMFVRTYIGKYGFIFRLSVTFKLLWLRA
jgi:hypothetical protein